MFIRNLAVIKIKVFMGKYLVEMRVVYNSAALVQILQNNVLQVYWPLVTVYFN